MLIAAPCAASASNCIVSPRGLFRVHRFHSMQGHGGVPISVTLNFFLRPSERTFLRIVLGRQALSTNVRQVAKSGVWELDAVVPPMENDNMEPLAVPITAQALTESNGILDAVTVGTYTYLTCKSATSHGVRSGAHITGIQPTAPLWASTPPAPPIVTTVWTTIARARTTSGRLPCSVPTAVPPQGSQIGNTPYHPVTATRCSRRRRHRPRVAAPPRRVPRVRASARPRPSRLSARAKSRLSCAPGGSALARSRPSRTAPCSRS